MDPIHPRFAARDGDFYDDPRREQNDAEPAFEIPTDLDWEYWDRVSDGHWTFVHPEAHVLPEQGWKIHLSTTASEATRLLEIVAAYCRRKKLAFKHLASARVLASMNAKDADRTASGKFITIYPATDEALAATVETLGAMTTGFHGPHILSDLRWHDSPVFVRYGGFRHIEVDVDGVSVPAIRTPAGDLVPDVRGTVFRVPEWVTIPPFLAKLADAQQSSERLPGFPDVTKVLHFSNAGGVYQAIAGDETVVLKEARPFAGITPDGRDAAQRLQDEAAVLGAVQKPGIVRSLGTFEVLEHRFLMTEYLDGRPLSTAVVARHPLVRADADDTRVREYRDWALAITTQVDDIVRSVHAAGYTHGDLHPGNFVVRDDDTVTLIDFEMARPVDDVSSAVIGAPGFVPPDGRRGIALDDYALACIKLFVFAPLTPILNAHPSKAHELVMWARDRFDLSAQWVDDVMCGLDAGAPAPTRRRRAQRADEHIAQLRAQLVADATPEREDRLWPGDPLQFSEPPYALAHGAAGPLLALHHAQGDVPAPLIDWLEASVRRSGDRRPGLMDGLSGAAVVLRRSGRADTARDAIAEVGRLEVDGSNQTLYGGLAGIGLAYLEFAEDDAEFLSRAERIGYRLLHRHDVSAPSPFASVATGASGLLRGPSGAALFLLQLYDRTGNPSLLAAADDRIRQDLSAIRATVDGSFQVDEGWRLLPYLGSGSVGVGYAILELLARAPESALRAQLEGIILAAHSEFVLEPGLSQGRAGLIWFLSSLQSRGYASGRSAQALERHLERLRLHAVPRPSGVGYPGRGLLRRSCDLATGSAGILLALTSGSDASLPFLGSAQRNPQP